MKEVVYHLLINATGLQCPRPLLKTKQTLGDMKPGHVLKVVATDKATRMTFSAYLKSSEDELLKMEEYAEEIHHYIRKK